MTTRVHTWSEADDAAITGNSGGIESDRYKYYNMIVEQYISIVYFIYAVLSFVEVTTLLLAVPGVLFLLSEKFCQDPLEAFFGKQRYKGDRNDNPSVKEFVDNTVSLRVQGSAALEPLRGNFSRKRKSKSLLMDDNPLPKRKRSSKI